MQIREITKQSWFWPITVIVGLLLVMTLSNRDSYTPEGILVVENDRQYSEAIKEAHEMTKPIFDKIDAGEDATDEEKATLIRAAALIDSANRFIPTKAITSLGAGKAYMFGGDLATAELRLQQCYNNSQLHNATEEDKLSGYEALYRLSQVYFDLGKFDTSLEMANNAVKAEPNGVNYLAARARALIQLKRYDDADRDLHQVLVLDPSHKLALALHQLLAAEDPKKFGPKTNH